MTFLLIFLKLLRRWPCWASWATTKEFSYRQDYRYIYFNKKNSYTNVFYIISTDIRWIYSHEGISSGVTHIERSLWDFSYKHYGNEDVSIKSANRLETCRLLWGFSLCQRFQDDKLILYWNFCARAHRGSHFPGIFFIYRPVSVLSTWNLYSGKWRKKYYSRIWK